MLRGETEPKYGLRKLSIGLVSAMIGMTTFMVVNGHADDSAVKADNVAGTAVANDNSVGRPYSVDNSVAGSAADVESAAISAAGWNNSGAKSDDTTVGPVNSQTPVAFSTPDNEDKVTFSPQSWAAIPVGALYESKVSQQSNVVAQNVSADWYWSNNRLDSSQTIQRTIGNDYDRTGMDFSFDVDGSQLKDGNVIDIAKIVQTSDNQGVSTFVAENTSIPISLSGQNIGTIELTPKGTSAPQYATGSRFSELDYQLKVTNPNLNFTGLQHLQIHLGWCGTLNYQGSWAFRGVKESNISYHFIGNGLDKTYRVHYAWPQITVKNEVKLFDGANPHAGSFLTNSGWTNPGIWIYGPIIHGEDAGQLKLFHDSDGKQGSFNINKDYRMGLHVYADKGNSILTNLWDTDQFVPEYPMMDSNGGLITVSPNQSFDWDTWNMVQFYPNAGIAIPEKKVADGLSLAQLKALNFKGMVASQQSDGSLLCYFDIPNKMLQGNVSNISDETLATIATRTPYINYLAKNDQDAINIARQMVKNWANSPMQGTPEKYRLEIANGITVSDPTSEPHVFADMLDPDSGQVLNSSKETGVYTFSNIEGQSTVKMHTINAQTGLDVQQVWTNSDWPNQGKKANLVANVPAGYQLVTDAQTAQNVLNKFHLLGTVLTASTWVDYPTADTTADYYFVVEPVQHTVTYQFVDINEDNKNVGSPIIVTGKTGASAPVSLTIPKYFDLADNQSLPTSVTIGDSDSTVLIYLKHHIDSQTRHYRVIENLPDGTQKVIIELNATIYKDAATDKWMAEGAFADGDYSKSLLKRNDYQVISGIYDPNSPFDDFLHADVDRIAGYKPVMIDGFNGEYRDLVMSNFNADQYLAYFDLFYTTVGSSDHDDWTEGSDVLPSRDFHINYVPIANQATVTIRYRDIVTGKIVNTTAQRIIGKHEITYQAPNGYKIVDVDKLPVTVTANNNGSVSAIDTNGNVVTDPDIVVTIDADTNLKDPTITRDPVHFNNDLSFDHAQQDKITRIVHFVSDNGQTLSPDLVQTIVWNSSIKNGQVVDGDTNVSKNFGEFTVPTIDGYTVDGIEGVNHDELVSHNQPFNEVITIYYHRSDVPLHGSTTITVPVIGDNEKIPINPGDPRYKDTQRTIERTLLAKNPITGDIVHVKNQMYTFTRDEYWDPITKTVYYGNWSDNGVYGFPELTGDVPVFAGYKANIPDGIGLVSAGPDYGHQTFTVTYTGNPQTAYVKYIDDGDHGKVLSTVKLTGVSQQEINYSPTATINKYLSEGYVLSSNNMAQGPFYFDIVDDRDQNFEIHFNHGTVEVTPGNPQNPGSPINPGDSNGPRYPKGVAKNDLTHVVHRTVHYVFTNGKTPLDDINQDLVYNETLTIDKVTGQIIRAVWTDNQDFEVAVSPIVQGYTPDRQQVVDNNIAHDHADIIETVTYSPDAQTAVVTYIDDTTGKTLLTKTITGFSDQDSGYSAHEQIQSYLNRGYQVVSDGTNGGNVIFDHIDNVNQQIEVHLAHTYEPAHQDDQVIRHIVVEDPHNGSSTTTQTVDVHRDGTRDRVTDYIDWKPWTKGEIPEFKVPIVPGYKPNYSDVPAEPTNDNKVPADDNLKIIYHALPQQLVINYITMDGQQAGSQKLAGVTDEVINVKPKTPVGYQLIAGTVPATYTLSYEDNELDIMVAVARNFRSYKTGDSDLVRTVTRLINIVRPDYTNGAVLQQVTLVRNAWMDEKGNTLSYTDWTPLNTNRFSSYVPPVIDGYIAQVAKEAKVDANTPNQQFVVLRYNEVDPASQHPMYIDAQGKTYDELPIGYQIVAGQNGNSGSMLIVPVNSHPLVPELKYYTRTVTITMPNGKQRVIRQRVAAGKAFNQVHLPKLRGFKAVITGNVDRAAANGDLIASVEFVKI